MTKAKKITPKPVLSQSFRRQLREQKKNKILLSLFLETSKRRNVLSNYDTSRRFSKTLAVCT